MTVGARIKPLSRREKQILRGIVRGWKYREIADDLGLSYETIKTYAQRLREKLNVTSKVQLAIWALKHPPGKRRG